MQVPIDSFPNASHGWTIESAEAIAKTDGFSMNDEHWQLVGALQEYYHRVEHPKLRQI